MNNVINTIVFILVTFSRLLAQPLPTSPLPDTLTIKTYNAGLSTPKSQDRLTIEYNAENRKSKVTIESFNIATLSYKFVSDSVFTYLHDGRIARIKIKSNEWIFMYNQFGKDSVRILRSINNINNIAQKISYEYDTHSNLLAKKHDTKVGNILGPWKYEISKFDSKNNRILYTTELYTNGSLLPSTNEWSFTYSLDNKLHTEILRYKDAPIGSAWDWVRKKEYIYKDQDTKVDEIQHYYFNNDWVTSYKSAYFYSPKELKLIYGVGLSHTPYLQQDITKYNDKGQKINFEVMNYYEWTSGNVLKLTSYDDYIYNSNGAYDTIRYSRPKNTEEPGNEMYVYAEYSFGYRVKIDNDGDGFYTDLDCDDNNAAINPNAVEIANNTVDENCDGTILIIDVDGDGFNSSLDCDDTNASINPNAVEIPNNTVDENCDGTILIIDVDGDGFNSSLDCDDTNAAINPTATEIPNNTVDENCDGTILIIDVDGDGFNSSLDCDDSNAAINPNAVEIPNNIVDENCDGTILIIDVDGDGSNSSLDCDDSNAAINPNAVEIPNNTIDENCDGTILIIDVDGDGFNSSLDCDDANAAINPNAVEIPNNAVDENCDGLILSKTEETEQIQVGIFPNPSIDKMNVTCNTCIITKCSLINVNGQFIQILYPNTNSLILERKESSKGIYFVQLQTDKRMVTKMISWH